MDEGRQELVSRYLDGDLDDAEATRLEERADHDAEIASAIRAAGRLKQAVAALADQMEPPVSLDAVMEPLRQSTPPPPRLVRPMYRWLGAAAAVVLGVTVAMEVARRNPEPNLSRPAPSREQLSKEEGEVFQLAPLPTANPDENHPLGAVDRLLEEEPQEPAAPEPGPLEVMGPLQGEVSPQDSVKISSSRDGQTSSAGGKNESKLTDSAVASAALDSAADPEVSEELAALPAPTKSRSYADEDHGATARISGTAEEKRARAGRERRAIEPAAMLRINGAEVWKGSPSSCPDGLWELRVEVRDNTVIAFELVLDDAEMRKDGVCRPDNLVGAILTGVDDGSYPAELLVRQSLSP